MANTMTGRVIFIGQPQSINTKSGTLFTKRELVLDCTRFDPYTGERGFENTPVFTFAQNNCSLLDNIQPGMVVTVSFDINGRRSTDPAKPDIYYNDVRGYKIDVVRQYASVSEQTPAQVVNPAPAPQPYATQNPYAAAPANPYSGQQYPSQSYTEPQTGNPFAYNASQQSNSPF